MYDFDVIVVGGGAAGFFGAIQIAQKNPELKIAILEKSNQVLSKVKVSGGGRCNVTHAEYDPKSLSKNYPRGEKELLGPFHKFCTGDTVKFFEDRDVPLKTESDGRIFPRSNSSSTIIECFLKAIEDLGVHLLKNTAVTELVPEKSENSLTFLGWKVRTLKKDFITKKLLLTTGSSQKIWKLLATLGHKIVPPVPSLFTFNIIDERIKGIQGISCNAAIEVMPKKNLNKEISIALKSNIPRSEKLRAEGPLLITHWGMSGPAILKLSAWGARTLNAFEYKFRIMVNWLPDYHVEGVLRHLLQIKGIEPKKTILRTQAFEIPRRLWIKLVTAAGISREKQWASISSRELDALVRQLTASYFTVTGKSTFKEEFVTAGGIDLKEINFKTFESKIHPHLFFAGEIINVDAITGGFNFQNAWTGAYIAAQEIAKTY